MDHIIITYGLTAKQWELLQAAVPEGYEVHLTECVTDLIVTNPVCTIVEMETLRKDGVRALLAYYMDVGDRLDGTVVWLGKNNLPVLPSFVRCSSFLDLLTDLDSILTQTQIRYDTMQMYTSEYGYLPKHAIQESMEADVCAALHRKYGDNPDPKIAKQECREWQAVLEAGGAEELAAVYELSRWLKRNGLAYRLDCKTGFPFVLELLDIVKDTSVYPQDYNPLQQKSRHKPSYMFRLSESLKPQIARWLEYHWLNTSSAAPTKLLALENIRFAWIFNQQ